MGQGYNLLGFVVIMILYVVIGLMAAAGAIQIARKFLSSRAEQVFYAMFLIMIASFYLAFSAYFGVKEAFCSGSFARRSASIRAVIRRDVTCANRSAFVSCRCLSPGPR